MQSDLRKLARGGGVMLVAQVLGSALLLALDVWTNGLLGNAGYGLFNNVKRVLQLGAFVVGLGMENAVIRYVATARSAEVARAVTARALAATVLAGLAGAGALAALAGRYAAWVDPAPATVIALQIAAFALPIGAVRLVTVSAAQGRGAVAPRAWILFVAWPIVQLAGVYVFVVRLDAGPVGAVIAWVSAMAFGAGLGAIAWRRVGRSDVPAPSTGAVELAPDVRALLAYSWPMWVQGVVMGAYTWLDQLLLAGLRSVTEAGVYGPVNAITPLLGLGLGALNGPFAPLIAEKHAQGDRDGLERLYRTVTRWAVALAVPPVAVCVAAPMAVLGVWPNGSPDAVPALWITCLTQLFCTAVGSVNYLLIMAGQPRAALWNGLIALASATVASLLLVPPLGVTGAALANAVAMCVANGVAMAQVWAHLRIHPFDLGLGKVVLAGVPVAVITAALRATDAPGWVVLVGAGTLGGVAFVASVLAMGITEDDRRVLEAVRRRLGWA